MVIRPSVKGRRERTGSRGGAAGATPDGFVSVLSASSVMAGRRRQNAIRCAALGKDWKTLRNRFPLLSREDSGRSNCRFLVLGALSKSDAIKSHCGALATMWDY